MATIILWQYYSKSNSSIQQEICTSNVLATKLFHRLYSFLTQKRQFCNDNTAKNIMYFNNHII